MTEINTMITELVFLSTPSARRATLSDDDRKVIQQDFYPRPPRGGRLVSPPVQDFRQYISIHALREEGDHPAPAHRCCPAGISIHALREEGDGSSSQERGGGKGFLSTPSARRATQGRAGCRAAAAISIHALREEGDNLAFHFIAPLAYFYPRPPRGGRRG